MPDVTYKWIVDFAVVVSSLSLLAWILNAILQARSRRKAERVRAHEAIYEDVSFLLEYPFHRRRAATDALEYENDDPDLQAAVRTYLDAHWMEQFWPGSRFVPEAARTEEERRAFIQHVRKEASTFRDRLLEHQIAVTIPEQSPIYHLDDTEVHAALNRVLKRVGGHLSQFNQGIRRSWEDAKSKDPADIRHEYELGRRVCPNFHEHNPRDVDDPFYDLLVALRQEYRKLTQPALEPLKWNLWRWRLKLRHPIVALRTRRKRRT